MAGRPQPVPIVGPPDFGKNVIILDINVDGKDSPLLKHKLDTIRKISKVQTEDGSEFGQDRYAVLIKAGTYQLFDGMSEVGIDVGYYMTVHGLGDDPDKVVIEGQIRSLGSKNPATLGLALNNFWRGAENLAIKPKDAKGDQSVNRWAVSQATFMRRVHIKEGNVDLFDLDPLHPRPDWSWPAGESSGGFIADSCFDGTVSSGSQQQFFSRNSRFTKGWLGGVWNMVFAGCANPPKGSWTELGMSADPNGERPYTTIEIDKMPLIREKPYLTCDSNNNYTVQVPPLRTRPTEGGNTWSGPPGSKSKGKAIPVSQCFVAKAGTFAATASELNKQLAKGYHLILTPGVYHLAQSLVVNHPDTIILGLGMATLVPDYGSPAMIIADVEGVSISGIIFDAGPLRSDSLLILGYNCLQGLSGLTRGVDHSGNPTAVFDCCARVGPGQVATQNCFTVNSNDVILDNIWLWRADHGRMGSHDPSVVGWDTNPADNGLTVNGDRVVAYGLFVEHFKQYQTVWNGNFGTVYFYQSEIPYDVPNQMKWRSEAKQQGFASYKVGDGVVKHTASGLGAYCNFWYYDIKLGTAIEVPTLMSDKPELNNRDIKMENMCTVWLDGAAGSGIMNVVDAIGTELKDKGRAVLTKDDPKPSRVLKLEAKK